MSVPIPDNERCETRHRMAPGRMPVRCERLAMHSGDCLVSWDGQVWDVSRRGMEDHPPRLVKRSQEFKEAERERRNDEFSAT